jgi:pimeloyl-ACP methyl ester carboxylesterase
MEKQKIIFIPGFKGSFLADQQTKKRTWITLFQALWSNASLTIDHQPMKADKIKEDGIFDSISIIPGILKVDIYGGFLQHLKKNLPSHFQVFCFSYDWRKSCVETAQFLDTFIKNHQVNSFVILLAHSMGGLIASYYLRYGNKGLESKENWQGTKFVSKVVFSGVPFRGCPRVFLDVHQGVRTLLNTSLLSSEAMFSFPSSYELLPNPDNTFFYDQDESETLSIYNSDQWLRHKWSIFKKPGLSKESKEENLIFLKKQLKNSIHFHENLHANEKSRPDAFPEVLNLVGISNPTLSRIYELGNAKKTFSSLNSDGDETVTTESAKLPKFFYEISQNKEVLFPGKHRKLLNEKRAIKEIFDFLMN